MAGIVKMLAENNARGKELKGEEEARTKEGIDMLAKTSALRANIETWTTDQQDILSTAALEQATTMPPFFLSQCRSSLRDECLLGRDSVK